MDLLTEYQLTFPLLTVASDSINSGQMCFAFLNCVVGIFFNKTSDLKALAEPSMLNSENNSTFENISFSSSPLF